tara:strand:- start:159 stop:449 length:291 start_codon:yes stop_codon:yes gene_type:complete
MTSLLMTRILFNKKIFHIPVPTELNTQEQSGGLMKKVLFGLGTIFVIVGVIRQWPLVGKTYMEFIEGKGYLALMLGLIMIVLGFSVPLLMGDEEDS